MNNLGFFETLAGLMPQELYDKYIVPRENSRKILDLSYVWDDALKPLKSSLRFGETKISTAQLEQLPDAQIRTLYVSLALTKLPHLTPEILEIATIANLSKKTLGNRIAVAGIAGPGAVGKTTLVQYLIDYTNGKGYAKMIMDTTREMRRTEKNGRDYHFFLVPEFLAKKKQGEFVLTSYLEGRGHYGLEKSVIANTISTGKIALLEGQPKNLVKVAGYMEKELGIHNQFLLIYLLPRLPLFQNLVPRLASRCETDGTDFLKTLEPTLGKRQVEELASVVECSKKVPTLILVNDTIVRVGGLAHSMLESNGHKPQTKERS